MKGMRKIKRRLDDLDARLRPAQREEIIVVLEHVNPDGTVTSSETFKMNPGKKWAP